MCWYIYISKNIVQLPKRSSALIFNRLGVLVPRFLKAYTFKCQVVLVPICLMAYIFKYWEVQVGLMFKCLDFQMPRCLMAYMFKCLITPCLLLSSCTLYKCDQPPKKPHALSTSMLLCKMIRCYLQYNPQLPATSHMMHTTCCNMRDATELCTNAKLHMHHLLLCLLPSGPLLPAADYWGHIWPWHLCHRHLTMVTHWVITPRSEYGLSLTLWW